MIVTCAHCLKRYMLDDILVPQEGRQVRCVSCHHVWRQVPESPSFVNPPPFFELSHAEGFAEGKPFSKKRFRGVGFVLCLALFLSFISCLIFGRNLIVTLWPESEKIYERFGLPISLTGAGLAIVNTTSLVHQDGPQEMVVVRGTVSNTSDRARPMSPLKINIIGMSPQDNQNTKRILDYWEHHFSQTSLSPGEQIHFETAPRPKVEGTQSVAVEF